MKTFFTIKLIFLLLVSFSWSYAQQPPLRFEHDWGPPGNERGVHPSIMLQDRKGFLWFGLAKYDGHGFKYYKYDPLDSTSFPGTGIHQLWEDQTGMIWLGTSEATCRFDPRTETFTPLERSPANPFAIVHASAFNEDREGNIWTASQSGELRRVDRKTGRYSSTDYAPLLGRVSDSSSLQKEYVGVIYRDKKGALWIGSLTGLHQLVLTPQGKGKPSKVSFIHYRHDSANPNSLSNNQVRSIFEDSKGVLWVGCGDPYDESSTGKGGLNAFDRKCGQFTRYGHEPNLPHSLSGNSVTSFAEDSTGNLWVGTTRGLNLLNPQRTSFTRFLHDSLDVSSLRNNHVGSLLMDQSGILWVGTTNGVDKLDTRQKPFAHYRHHPSDASSLSHNAVSSILEDEKGTLWIGTLGGGLNAWDKKTNRFTHYRHHAQDPHSLFTDRVSALIQDRQHNLWVASGEVISRLDKETGKFTHFPLKHPFLPGGFYADPIFALCKDKEGMLWLGTTNGIIRFDPQSGAIRSYTHTPYSPDGVSDWWSMALLEDSRGNLWIGHGSQALDKFDRKRGKFIRYQHDRHNLRSLSSNATASLYEDSKGNLWVGTWSGGLGRFDYASESFTIFTDKHGLAGNTVFSILEDNHGDLWLGTDNGLSRFSLEKQTFTNYDVYDGLQSNLFTTAYVGGACFKGRDGMLYFGGNNGFNVFNPAHIRPSSIVPRVVITRFRLFDQPLPGKHESTLIELDYDENFFSLDFALLSYRSPHKNRYAYQLVGVDKTWVYSGTRHSSTYTDVAPGKYIFRVKGSNNDGVWNQAGTSLTILIHPPFWKTWWAYTMYGLCFLAGVLAIDRFQRRRLIQREREKARERELEQAREIEKANKALAQQKEELQSTLDHLKTTQAQLLKQEKAGLENELKLERLKQEQELALYQSRAVELEMQALRAQMNPHFIFNCLNSINRFMLKNESEAASDYLTKFSKLIRLILQNSQFRAVPLENELEALRLYMEMEMLRFEGQFDYVISYHPDLEVEDLEVPPLIIQPYVENAIWHGLMHKQDQGHLEIELGRENGTLYCQITDDGVGRKRAAELKSKSASKNKSLGMQITAHRLELINTLSDKATTVDVIDLVDTSGEACGTRVVLKIPV
jgi:ligand-binding sensor domain-containing protein